MKLNELSDYFYEELEKEIATINSSKVRVEGRP